MRPPGLGEEQTVREEGWPDPPAGGAFLYNQDTEHGIDVSRAWEAARQYGRRVQAALGAYQRRLEDLEQHKSYLVERIRLDRILRAKEATAKAEALSRVLKQQQVRDQWQNERNEQLRNQALEALHWPLTLGSRHTENERRLQDQLKLLRQEILRHAKAPGGVVFRPGKNECAPLRQTESLSRCASGLSVDSADRVQSGVQNAYAGPSPRKDPDDGDNQGLLLKSRSCEKVVHSAQGHHATGYDFLARSRGGVRRPLEGCAGDPGAGSSSGSASSSSLPKQADKARRSSDSFSGRGGALHAKEPVRLQLLALQYEEEVARLNRPEKRLSLLAQTENSQRIRSFLSRAAPQGECARNLISPTSSSGAAGSQALQTEARREKASPELCLGHRGREDSPARTEQRAAVNEGRAGKVESRAKDDARLDSQNLDAASAQSPLPPLVGPRAADLPRETGSHSTSPREAEDCEESQQARGLRSGGCSKREVSAACAVSARHAVCGGTTSPTPRASQGRHDGEVDAASRPGAPSPQVTSDSGSVQKQRVLENEERTDCSDTRQAARARSSDPLPVEGSTKLAAADSPKRRMTSSPEGVTHATKKKEKSIAPAPWQIAASPADSLPGDSTFSAKPDKTSEWEIPPHCGKKSDTSFSSASERVRWSPGAEASKDEVPRSEEDEIELLLRGL